MNNLNNYIQEKLKINSQTKIISGFTDEELKNDYSEISGAYLKSQKEPLALKYGVTSIKIRDIQLAILDQLRENRKKKKEFTMEDVRYFIKYDMPDSYNRYKVYLDQESKEFVEYILEYYKNRGKNISPYPGRQSIADKYVLKKIENIQKYLGHK